MHEMTAGKWYSGVDIGEVLRYSGIISPDKCENGIITQAGRAAEQVGEAALPKKISRECALEISGKTCVIDGIQINSDSLAKHLAGCDRAVLFAATLGSGVDMLINRYSAIKMSYAVILQGAAAAEIEYYCDCVCAEMEAQYEKEGCYLLPRFSPGYGDFSLEYQEILTNHLNAYKYTGIAVSVGGQMTPMKSVSAVIGISRTRSSAGGSCASGKCSKCLNFGCVFRRN